MNFQEVMMELERLGNPSTKKVLMKHGAVEPFFGVKIGDMKPLVKRIKKDYDLSIALYKSGNGDAMYLAGLIADEKKMTMADLDDWVKRATYSMISEFTVPWIAAESDYGWECALNWIGSSDEKIASSGWATLSSLVSIKADEDLDTKALSRLIEEVEENIHDAPNRVRYTMNGYIIAVGSYVAALTDKAKAAAQKIGNVSVFMGDTACKVPPAYEYISKIEKMNRVGAKRKMARC